MNLKDMNLKDINELHDILIKQILDKDIHKQCESIAKKFGRYYLSNWGTDGGESNYRLIVNDLNIHFQTWVSDPNYMEITILNRPTNKMLFGYRFVDGREFIDEYISGEWEEIINNIYETGKLPEVKIDKNNKTNGMLDRFLNWFKTKKEKTNE